MTRASWSLGVSLLCYFSGFALLISVGILAQLFFQFLGLVITELCLLVVAVVPVILWITSKTGDRDTPSLQSPPLTTELVEELGLRPIKGKLGVLTDILMGILWGILTLFLAIPIVALWTWLITPPPTYLEAMSHALTPSNPFELVMWILFMIFIVGFCEEVFARSVLQQGSENYLGRWGGLLLASALFAGLHLDIYRFGPIFFISTLWGLRFQKSGYSLYTTWAAHSTNNSIAIIMLYLAQFMGLI
ncbi:MAG: lysostaphin resistance A-like protein [Promethearchaeota archaeon]